MRGRPLRVLERRLGVVWGANTDVGKTLVSIGLLARAGGPSKYIKPVQTGSVHDEQLIANYVHSSKADTLFQYSRPLSPDLAATLEAGEEAVSDERLLSALMVAIDSLAHTVLVETAGGVLSPAPSGSPQADVYRPLRLPALLVGDTRLGGISATCSALESLIIRGYDVPVVVMPALPGVEKELANHNADAVRRAIKGYGLDKAIRVLPVSQAPPSPSVTVNDDLVPWLDQTKQDFNDIHEQWSRWSERRNSDLCWSASQACESLWWPFTQHASIGPADVTVVDSAYRDSLSVYKPKSSRTVSSPHIQEQFDAVGGWWTNAAIRGTPSAALAAGRAIGRYGHVLFPEITHEPAVTLADKILRGPGRPWASRVFFSDDGSTGVEVALKMAFRLFARQSSGRSGPSNEPMAVLSLAGSYHGDTLAAMDCCPRSTFNSGQIPWYKPRGLFINSPQVRLASGVWTVMDGEEARTYGSLEEILDCESRVASDPVWAMYTDRVRTELERFEANNCTVGATIIEPVMQAASGMYLVDPLLQRAIVATSRERGIPVVYDEVFTGFWRLGVESARDILGVDPDIAVYAKLMTGGTTTLAATVASRAVFESFLGSSKEEALLHGHSYSGNPVACCMALETLGSFSRANAQQLSGVRWNNKLAVELSKLECVHGVVALGTVLAVELKSGASNGRDTYGSNSMAKEIAMELRRRNIYTRPLGNVVYVMVSPTTEAAEAQMVGSALLAVLSDHDQTRCS